MWDYWWFAIVILSWRSPWFCFKLLTGFSSAIYQESSGFSSDKRLYNSLSASFPCSPLSLPILMLWFVYASAFHFSMFRRFKSPDRSWGSLHSSWELKGERLSSLFCFWPPLPHPNDGLRLNLFIIDVEFIPGTVSVSAGTGICLEQIDRWVLCSYQHSDCTVVIFNSKYNVFFFLFSNAKHTQMSAAMLTLVRDLELWWVAVY